MNGHLMHTNGISQEATDEIFDHWLSAQTGSSSGDDTAASEVTQQASEEKKEEPVPSATDETVVDETERRAPIETASRAESRHTDALLLARDWRTDPEDHDVYRDVYLMDLWREQQRAAGRSDEGQPRVHPRYYEEERVTAFLERDRCNCRSPVHEYPACAARSHRGRHIPLACQCEKFLTTHTALCNQAWAIYLEQRGTSMEWYRAALEIHRANFNRWVRGRRRRDVVTYQLVPY